MTDIIFYVLFALLFGIMIGWLIAHVIIRYECEKHKNFYLGSKIYRCEEIIETNPENK